MSGTINFHVIFHCEIACALWNGIFSPVRLSWIMRSRVVDLFACWRGVFGSIQSVVVLCLHAICGGFGVKEIIEVSKTARRQWWSLNLFSSTLFTFG
jgi:hypothetical protein